MGRTSTRTEEMQKYMPVTLYDSNNNPVVVEDISAWCKQNGFIPARFYNLLVTRDTQYATYSAYGYTLVPDKNQRSETFVLTDPDNNEIVVENLGAWCKERGYDKSTFYKLVRGFRKSAYGYTSREI